MLSKGRISLIMIVVLCFEQICHAQLPSRQFGDDLYQSRINEYFFNETGKEILEPIKIIGSVQKPGLYHLPTNTPLTTLLAISGGATSDASLKEIIVRRSNGSVVTKDLFTVVTKSDDLSLKEGDVIYIPKQEGFISSPNATSILVLTSVLSVVLSGIIVSRGNR